MHAQDENATLDDQGQTDPDAPQDAPLDDPQQQDDSQAASSDSPVDPDSPESMADIGALQRNDTADDANNTDAAPLVPLTQPDEMRLQQVDGSKPLSVRVLGGAAASSSPLSPIAPPTGPLGAAGAPFLTNGEVKRCVPNGADGCTVRFDASSMQWTTRLVAPGSIAPATPQQAGGPNLNLPPMPALNLDAPLPSLKLNDDPTIRAAEQDYLAKRERLNREQAWVMQVRSLCVRKLAQCLNHAASFQVKGLIREYQEKVRKATADVSSLRVQVRQSAGLSPSLFLTRLVRPAHPVPPQHPNRCPRQEGG
jgi:hypothetical protein